MDPANTAWTQAQEVEWLEVTVVVDNVTDMLSDPCDAAASDGCTVSSERTRGVAAVRSGQAPQLDFGHGLHAAHGLSLLLRAQPAGGGPPRTLLFDAGPAGEVWRLNAQRLGLSPVGIEAVVLSHWHMDHSGGLPEVAAMIAESRSRLAQEGAAASLPPPAVFDVHPHRPACRGAMLPSGQPVPFNQDPGLEELAVEGATRVEPHAEPHTQCGCFFVSGEIPRHSAYEAGNPNNASLWEEGGTWERDPLVLDERYVAVRVKGRGAVVLSACSHAGIVNVMSHVKQLDGAAPHAVIGGLHLSTSDCVDRIEATAKDIAAMQPALVVAGHCTGWRAQAHLIHTLPGRCMPSSVGHTYSFRAPA